MTRAKNVKRVPNVPAIAPPVQAYAVTITTVVVASSKEEAERLALRYTDCLPDAAVATPLEQFPPQVDGSWVCLWPRNDAAAVYSAVSAAGVRGTGEDEDPDTGRNLVLRDLIAAGLAPKLHSRRRVTAISK